MCSINNYENVASIHEITNKRIYDRNIPSKLLQPYIDVRPVLTKYSFFPIVDPRKELNTKFQQLPTYDINTTFNPGNRHGPFSGLASNINIESDLRNQIYAIQKCSQAVYIPSSNSDLYNYSFNTPKIYNPHELLFKNEVFSSFNPNENTNKCGIGLFYNSTRCQVKENTKQIC
jgi:hypothetical protein